MEILLKGWSWLIESKIYIAVLLFVVIFIIGWLFSMLEKSFTKKLKDEDDLEKFRLQERVENATEEELTQVVKELNISEKKTINIYYAGADIINIHFHNAMVRLLQIHLEMSGFKEKMNHIDAMELPRWKCPVLVIYPEGNFYTFHADQDEDRSASKSFTILTNSETELASVIDIEIKRMRGEG
jgi:hypothetical protein